MMNPVATLVSVINDHHYCGLSCEWLNKPATSTVNVQSITLQPEDECLNSILLPKPPELDDISDENNNFYGILRTPSTKTIKTKSILKTSTKTINTPSSKKRVTFEKMATPKPCRNDVTSGAHLNSKRKLISNLSINQTNVNTLKNALTKKANVKTHKNAPAKPANVNTLQNAPAKPANVKTHKKTPQNLHECTGFDEYTHDALEKLAREAYSCVRNCSREEAETKIIETEIRMKVLHDAESSDSPQNVPKSPEIRLDADNITRIKELFPPDNYEPPSDEKRDLQCIRRFSEYNLPPDVNTLRCISNYRVHPDENANSYQTSGDYYSANIVNYLPEPSIWTPQHALMNTAPCISSPGIFEHTYMGTYSSDESDGTNTDEELAIY